jgi:hypothetical protein
MHQALGEKGCFLENVVQVAAGIRGHSRCAVHEAHLVVGYLVVLEAWASPPFPPLQRRNMLAKWHGEGNGAVIGDDRDVGPGVQRQGNVGHGLTQDDVVLESGGGELP